MYYENEQYDVEWEVFSLHVCAPLVAVPSPQYIYMYVKHVSYYFHNTD